MNTTNISNLPSVHTVLSKLIVLTNERDVAALEVSMAQSIFDLIMPINKKNNPVVIYRIKDINKQQFSSVVIGDVEMEDEIHPQMISALTDCFGAGAFSSFQHADELCTRLYPLKNSANKTMAVISVESSKYDSQQHETISMLLQIYQNFTGLLNDNEHDTLTGLLNRKTFEQKINKVLLQMQATAKRNGDKKNQSYFLAIFDIDHFKNVNDEFGHLIGDEVLLMFSQLMKQTYRDKDLLFRFGGEEFVGVFECASVGDIQHVLDRFRENICNHVFPQVGKVTVSAGYTLISAEDASSSLIDRADMALYYAKNHGRNRICNYEYLIATGDLQNNEKEGDIEIFEPAKTLNLVAA